MSASSVEYQLFELCKRSVCSVEELSVLSTALQSVLDSKAFNLDLHDDDGRTALHWACSSGNNTMSRCSTAPASKPVLQEPQVPLSHELATFMPALRRHSKMLRSAGTAMRWPLRRNTTSKAWFSAQPCWLAPKLSKWIWCVGQ